MSRQTFWQRFVAVVGVVMLVAVVGSGSPDVLADPKGYVFTPLAFLGDPAPGGGVFLDVFESNFINNRGDVLFGSNVTAVVEQGLFLLRKRVLSQIARVGETAPASSRPPPSTTMAMRVLSSCSTRSVFPPKVPPSE